MQCAILKELRFIKEQEVSELLISFRIKTPSSSANISGGAVTDAWSETLAISEIFIGTLKNKIYKYMTSVSKKVYIDKLAVIVEKCSNTYNSTIKMRYIYFIKENDKENPKFEAGDHKWKHSKLVWRCFAIKKVEKTVP